MKLFKNISFAAALLFATALLIAAFIVFFGYSYDASKDELKDHSPDESAVVSESAPELKTF